jgi:hypothetical protein
VPQQPETAAACSLVLWRLGIWPRIHSAIIEVSAGSQVLLEVRGESVSLLFWLPVFLSLRALPPPSKLAKQHLWGAASVDLPHFSDLSSADLVCF